jgi:hypothetical protein
MLETQTNREDPRYEFLTGVSDFYHAKKYREVEHMILSQVKDLLSSYESNSSPLVLKDLYQFIDPVYQLLYFDLQTKNVPIARKVKKILEIASLPLFDMPSEDQSQYIHQIKTFLA